MPPASPRALARARPALAPLRPRAPHPPPSSSSSSSSSSARRARPSVRGASSSSSSPAPAPSASTSEGGDTAAPTLVLYTKPGCCLCEGLAEKLEEVMSTRAGGAMGDVLRAMRLETRDVSARADWAEAHATEVPVVTLLVAPAAAGKEDDGGNDREGAPPREVPLPRPAPRLSAARLAVRLGQDVQSALSPGGGDGARARTGWAAPRRGERGAGDGGSKAAGGSNEANGGWTVVSERPF